MYVTLKDPLSGVRRRIYLGILSSEEFRRWKERFDWIKKPLPKHVAGQFRLEAEQYFKTECDNSTYTKPELALIWSILAYTELDQLRKRSRRGKGESYGEIVAH